MTVRRSATGSTVIEPSFRPTALAAWPASCKTPIDRRGRAPAAAGHRARRAPRADREGRGARHQRLCRQPARLLSQPPLAGQTVLGIDPGFRTGCKVAVVDPTGKLLDTDTIYPHEPQKRWNEALETLRELVSAPQCHPDRHRQRHRLARDRAAGGRADRRRRCRKPLRYLIVNEAGASVYTASPLARAELPDLDVSPARGGLDRPPGAGPAGRAGQDRPEVHRRGHVPARCRPGRADRSAGRRGGERGQPGGRGR